MPEQQPAISHEQPAVEEPAVDWLDDSDELPPRPRRRLLGAGGSPIALALLAVLLVACGFIGGVLVEKGQGGSSTASASSGAASLLSRFRALRAGAGAGASAGSAHTGGPSPAIAGFARPTAGTVAYLAGHTLYVTTAEGNTVKVTTSPRTSVTKTVKSSVKRIHPGETVTVTGATGANGAIGAEAISVGAGGGGGLAALFGGAGGGGLGGRGASGAGTGSGPALFGGG
jgi:hypothetical protein